MVMVNRRVAELRAYLASQGVEGWADPKHIGTPKFKWIPLKKLDSSHAGCMVERFRTREAARATGAADCAKHPGELEGDCVRCRGLWPDPPVYARAPLTREAFERLQLG